MEYRKRQALRSIGSLALYVALFSLALLAAADW